MVPNSIPEQKSKQVRVVPIGGSVTPVENLRLTEVNQVGVSVVNLDNKNQMHLDMERKDVKDVLNTDMQHPSTDQPSAVKRKKLAKDKNPTPGS